MACRGCNHHSGVLAPGSSLPIDNLLRDIELLLPRIHVWSHISVLGGEALIEPRTKEVLKLIRDMSKGVYVKIFSNGLLIPQNTDWILEHMKEGGIFRISLHIPPTDERLGRTDKTGDITYKNVRDFIEVAKKEGVDMSLLEISENWDDLWFDLLQWRDNKFYPWEDNNIEKSFEYCTAPNVQLYLGRLWKCPSIAYLRETLVSTGQVDDPVWQKYLNYHATPVDAPIEELYAMADQVLNPHEICNKCPSNPKWYRAIKQLKGVKSVVTV
tara:strand:+ start:713 stop:1522 length:810 start_codon:yes stop_codon:yes gene_type:complete